MRNLKTILCFLSLLLVNTVLVFTSCSEDEDDTQPSIATQSLDMPIATLVSEGITGELKWQLMSNGQLIISGNGVIPNFIIAII